MTALPKRVQRELDAANAAEAEFAARRAEHTAQAVPLGQPPAADPPVVVPVTPPVAATVPPAKPPEDFEHKFRVLQGMYEADVTRVKREVATVVAEIAALKQAPPAAPVVPQPDQKDVETFGADLIAMVQRYAEGQQAATNARLDALEQKVGVVSRTQTLTKEQTFWKDLRTAVPDVKQINEDQRWLAWLGQPDGLRSEPRQAALDAAFSAQDAAAVAKVFNAFKAELAAVVAPATESIESQVVPSGAGSTPPPAAPAVVYLSEKSIVDFYNDVGRGRYAGRDDKMNATEAEINLAVAEGRVR